MTHHITYLISIALMALSQVVSWQWILRWPLYQSVFRLSVFYFLWALYNRFIGGQIHELGHFTYLLTAIAAYYEKPRFCMAGTLLLFVQYAIAFYLCFSVSAGTWAQTIHGEVSKTAIIWAWAFRAYVISNLGLWGTAANKFSKNEVNDYTILPTTM
jgi:hypothetical protein